MKKITTIALSAVAALSVNLQPACAAEPFIPVFITDGERNVTPDLFPELSVFRESIPSYLVNSTSQTNSFTALSKAYTYPREYVRRLSDKERRLTPYRFDEMFEDPAKTIDSEYARSGKPFFVYERVSRPPFFLPRDGAPLAIRSSFEDWKRKHPGFLGLNSLWELDSDSSYFQRFYSNMKDPSIEKELHEAFGPPDEKGMAHRRRWAEKVFRVAEDFLFGEKRIFPLCSTFPGYEPVVTYEAKFDDDFEWSDVKTFDLTNSETGEVSSNIMLQKAVCTVTTDNCDSVFLEQYGVPYRIQNAFAQGYDLYFFVRSGKIVIPDDFADYFFLQETGLTTAPMNTSIYAMINTKESKFNTVEIGDSIDVNDIVLNIQFTDEDGEKDFGTADIILNNVTWTQIGTGT